MTEAPADPNYCYRHPDRQSWVLCQRCGRTICPECQTQAAVGVHCPECTRESRRSAPRTPSRVGTRFRSLRTAGGPVVTYALIALNVLAFVPILVTGGLGGIVGSAGGPVTSAMVFYAPLTLVEPWRLLTSLFAHASILHILFNMYALYLFGPALEQALGRVRFLVLYLLAGLGGSAAVTVLAPTTPVLGASGAIFGLFAAFFVIQRHLGGNATQILVVIALNLAIGFIVPGVAWQAHLGGAVFGALIALVYTRTRRRGQRPLQVLGLVGIAIVIALLLLSRFFVAY